MQEEGRPMGAPLRIHESEPETGCTRLIGPCNSSALSELHSAFSSARWIRAFTSFVAAGTKRSPVMRS